MRRRPMHVGTLAVIPQSYLSNEAAAKATDIRVIHFTTRHATLVPFAGDTYRSGRNNAIPQGIPSAAGTGNTMAAGLAVGARHA